jgi:uncharacterized Zn-finger protein
MNHLNMVDLEGPLTYHDFQSTSNAPKSTPHGLSPEPRTQSDSLSYTIQTRPIFICTYMTCNKRYARLTDLKRHHRGAHERNNQFKCRTLGCPRTARGFSRRDKRDSHERSMHMVRAGVLSLQNPDSGPFQ